MRINLTYQPQMSPMGNFAVIADADYGIGTGVLKLKT